MKLRNGFLFGSALWLLGIPLATSAAEEAATHEVKVERHESERAKLPNLRFLHANRDFLRARLDLLRQRPGARLGQTSPLDERQLLLRRILAEIAADRDTLRVDAAALADDRIASELAGLVRLQDQLDRMDGILGRQAERVSLLDADLRGEQETALIILLKGWPREFDPSDVQIGDEEGALQRIPLSADDRDALRRGGIVQVFHEYVEPRRHSFEFGLGGEGRIQVFADTPHDELSLLMLDLSAVASADDLSDLGARIWQD